MREKKKMLGNDGEEWKKEERNKNGGKREGIRKAVFELGKIWWNIIL